MLIKSLKNSQVMGFAQFQKQENVTTEEIIEKSLNWSESFLSEIEGLNFHCLLQNTRGRFADIILAENQKVMDTMNSSFGQSDASKLMLEVIDPKSVRLNLMDILKSDFELPDKFAAVEIGFMELPADTKHSESDILLASERLESDYLFQQRSTLQHFIGKTNMGRFTDVTFGRSLGSVRKSCLGFDQETSAQLFLNLFDEKSFELDFWSVLA